MMRYSSLKALNMRALFNFDENLKTSLALINKYSILNLMDMWR